MEEIQSFEVLVHISTPSQKIETLITTAVRALNLTLKKRLTN
jgi:hypothetical protein